jgi:hypothetical protein
LIGGAIIALGVAAATSAAQTTPPPGVAPGTAPAPQAALPPPGMKQQMRVRMMSDRVMTRNEVAGHVAKLFAKLDTNRDGFVTKDEVEAIHTRMMAAMDKTGDVEKRLAERGVFIGDRAAMFDRLDTNHDGNISRQEFTAGRPEVHQERVMIMRGGPDGAPGAPGALPPMDGHPGMGMEMHMRHMGGMGGKGMAGFGGHLFEMADANHDGRVSLAEAQAAALAHFDQADVNHDGKITPDERQQMHRTVRVERREG